MDNMSWGQSRKVIPWQRRSTGENSIAGKHSVSPGSVCRHNFHKNGTLKMIAAHEMMRREVLGCRCVMVSGGVVVGPYTVHCVLSQENITFCMKV